MRTGNPEGLCQEDKAAESEIDMKWNRETIDYWTEHYYAIREYELLPFEHRSVFGRDIISHGKRLGDAPYETQCDMNWDFDKALKKVGDVFRLFYIEGFSEQETIAKTGCSEGDIKESYKELENILKECSY